MKLLKELERADRFKHLVILGPIGSFIGAVFAVRYGLPHEVGILAGKEAADAIGPFGKKVTGWDWYDLLATFLGGGIYLIMIHPFLNSTTDCLGVADKLFDCFF